MLTPINLMAAQEVRVVFVTSNIDKDQRLEASRLVDAELGLLGLVARSESNWFEGWGRRFGVLVTRTSDGLWNGRDSRERFCLGVLRGSNPAPATNT